VAGSSSLEDKVLTTVANYNYEGQRQCNGKRRKMMKIIKSFHCFITQLNVWAWLEDERQLSGSSNFFYRL